MGDKNWIFLICICILVSWESYRPFAKFFVRKWQFRFVHGCINFGFGLLYVTMNSLFFVTFWYEVSLWTENYQFGILYYIPTTFAPIATVVVLDFCTYWWHWANHRFSFFWFFHQVHHMDRYMDVTTAVRFHFVEIAISSFLRIPIIVLFGIQFRYLVLYEIILFINITFHHANIHINEKLDKILRIFIVTPHLHKIHHSENSNERNTNYCSFFSIWDRVFGTYLISSRLSSIQFGVKDIQKKRG